MLVKLSIKNHMVCNFYSDLVRWLPYASYTAMYMATPTSGFSLNACYWFAAVISFIHGKLSQPCILYDEALICRGRGSPSPYHAQPCTPNTATWLACALGSLLHTALHPTIKSNCWCVFGFNNIAKYSF